MTEPATTLESVGDRWEVTGSMTMDSVAKLLEASKPLVTPQTGVVDLARVDRVDSAGVAVLLAWRRRAAAEGKPLRFADVPASLTSLALLYGVEEMLAD
jgi:phospholipid transport system transporter-binding protein